MNETTLSKLLPIQEASGIADILDFRARSQGQREALVCGDERVSYNDLKHQAQVFTKHLHQMGVKAGDRVGYYVPNSIDFVAGFFGAFAAGAIIVPINPLLKPDEIAHILSDSQSKTIVVHEELLPFVQQALPNIPSLQSMLVIPSTTLTARPTFPASLRIVELDRHQSVESILWPAQISSNQLPAIIIYTSGTTGKPKGAVLSHHNLLTSFPSRLEMFDVDENDRLLGALPMCHIFGVSVVILGAIGRGATLVILPKFEAKAALEIIEREHITLMPAVPAMYQMMLYELAQANYDLSSMRFCWSGGSPLPVEVLDQVTSKFGAPLIEGYGLTETSCVSTINPLHGARKPGSVGPAIPGVQVEIMDESGRLLPPGAENVGEIVVRGTNVMIGYYNQPQASAEALKDGWFHTGDLGYKDADEYFWIVGRKKELIIRGGQNVYPKEIEDIIAKLKGVREVAVIGVPDPIMGERVKAVVATGDSSLTEDRVKEHCEQFLANYKVPRIVEFVAALPRNSTGKVLKRVLV
jgi:long-chain acyl-CoA synthetase